MRMRGRNYRFAILYVIYLFDHPTGSNPHVEACSPSTGDNFSRKFRSRTEGPGEGFSLAEPETIASKYRRTGNDQCEMIS